MLLLCASGHWTLSHVNADWHNSSIPSASSSRDGSLSLEFGGPGHESLESTPTQPQPQESVCSLCLQYCVVVCICWWYVRILYNINVTHITHMRVYISACTHTCTHTHNTVQIVHVYMHVCVHTCMQVYMCACVRVFGCLVRQVYLICNYVKNAISAVISLVSSYLQGGFPFLLPSPWVAVIPHSLEGHPQQLPFREEA